MWQKVSEGDFCEKRFQIIGISSAKLNCENMRKEKITESIFEVKKGRKTGRGGKFHDKRNFTAHRSARRISATKA
jgi:hypothetical protein